MAKPSRKNPTAKLAKTPSGIAGLDELTLGGLPQGRPTLICGSAGCGKTLLSLEFLVRGAIHYDEPGVFLAFEETAEELAKNLASLGHDLNELIARKKIIVDYIHLDRSEIEEAGDYDLEGLFLRLGHAIDSIGAKRVGIDTLGAVFSAFTNQFILRSELRRLFRWLKDKGVTAVITAERGDGALTRHGLEEYVSDCVIMLDHRVIEQISTRRMRIVKYRGSHHGTNEYPFLIDDSGISVLPITSVGLNHEVSSERVSSGIPRLDTMLGGSGYYRGSSILVSGTAGSGKSSMAAHFVNAACKRQKRCLYIASEESPMQIVRNMGSIGIHLKPWMDKGLLRFHAVRPTFCSMEMHLALLHKTIDETKPRVVVVDPITTFTAIGNELDVKSMLTRLIDFLKLHRITGMFTNLTDGASALEKTDIGISSLVDTWLLLRNIETNGERNRGLYVLKSRGMAHSNQIREFVLSDDGIELLDVYLGPGGVLTGSARQTQEAEEKATAMKRRKELEGQQRVLDLKRKQIEAEIAALRAKFEAETKELEKSIIEARDSEHSRMATARLRKSDKLAQPNGKKGLQGEL
ncbi:MAG: circadian clock protein KaiC [Candidatus Binatia bacterium]